MSKIFPLIVILFTCTTFLVACTKDGNGGNGNADCSTNTSKNFAAHVLPIFQSSCSIPTCHQAGSINGPGALTNYLQISGNTVAIRLAVTTGSMPKNSSLTTAQKNSIICWIDSGAPNN